MSAPFVASSLNSPDLKGVSVLDHPFEFLAFFHLQRCGHGSRTDEVVLAVLTAPLNHLQFGEISHGSKLAIPLVNGKTFFHTFSLARRRGPPKCKLKLIAASSACAGLAVSRRPRFRNFVCLALFCVR